MLILNSYFVTIYIKNVNDGQPIALSICTSESAKLVAISGLPTIISKSCDVISCLSFAIA